MTPTSMMPRPQHDVIKRIVNSDGFKHVMLCLSVLLLIVFICISLSVVTIVSYRIAATVGGLPLYVAFVIAYCALFDYAGRNQWCLPQFDIPILGDFISFLLERENSVIEDDSDYMEPLQDPAFLLEKMTVGRDRLSSSSLSEAGTSATINTTPFSLHCSSETPTCSICLVDLHDRQEDDGTLCQGSVCGHRFHKSCLSDWLYTQYHAGHAPCFTCPYCRADLDTEAEIERTNDDLVAAGIKRHSH